MQVVPPARWHLVAKFISNASDTTRWLNFQLIMQVQVAKFDNVWICLDIFPILDNLNIQLIIEVGSFCDSELFRIVIEIFKEVWKERPALLLPFTFWSMFALTIWNQPNAQMNQKVTLALRIHHRQQIVDNFKTIILQRSFSCQFHRFNPFHNARHRDSAIIMNFPKVAECTKKTTPIVWMPQVEHHKARARQP